MPPSPSPALRIWLTESHERIDELIAAHRALGGAGPGRRTTTEQLNHMLLLKVCGEYQAYLRSLFTTCVNELARAAPSAMSGIFELMPQRTNLANGNPLPGQIGQDFQTISIDLWSAAESVDAEKTQISRSVVEVMFAWRNAIAHHDFPVRVNATHADRASGVVYADRVTLNVVRRGYLPTLRWPCRVFDSAAHSRMEELTGRPPW